MLHWKWQEPEGGGWPEGDRVQRSTGQLPPHHCAQTGLLCSLQAQGVFAVSVASSWWRWGLERGGVWALVGGEAGVRGWPLCQDSEYMGCRGSQLQP